MKFSAVILAGGKSSRMGRDKALLEVDGQPLLARQIQIARDAGADEVFISGRADADYTAFTCPVLRDRFLETGPLAGIEAALMATASPLLLALAVDLPGMDVDFLRRLAGQCAVGCGAIPRVDGFIEPLAAFYPKTSVSLLTELFDARIPLTPALSPGEREAQLPAARFSDERPANPAADLRERRQTALPLPEGEGQGEGERSVKSPSAKKFAERCVAAGLARFVDLPATDAHFFANWNSPTDVERTSPPDRAPKDLGKTKIKAPNLCPPQIFGCFSADHA